MKNLDVEQKTGFVNKIDILRAERLYLKIKLNEYETGKKNNNLVNFIISIIVHLYLFNLLCRVYKRNQRFIGESISDLLSDRNFEI